MTEGKSNFENVNDLIRATMWPLIVLIFFFAYNTEFNKIIKLIPDRLEQSSKISIGSLSFEIERTAKLTGNEELADIVKNLSEDGIRKLLTLGTGSHALIAHGSFIEGSISETSFNTPPDLDVLLELEKNGLIKGDEPLDKFWFSLKVSILKKIWEIRRKMDQLQSKDTKNIPKNLLNYQFHFHN